MNVYIIREIDYSHDPIEAVFTSLDAAKGWVEQRRKDKGAETLEWEEWQEGRWVDKHNGESNDGKAPEDYIFYADYAVDRWELSD